MLFNVAETYPHLIIKIKHGSLLNTEMSYISTIATQMQSLHMNYILELGLSVELGNNNIKNEEILLLIECIYP